MAKQWLKDAIVEHVRNTPNRNSIQICTHFKLRVDITYTAIRELEQEGRITRHNGALGGWNGNHYYSALAQEVTQ